MTHVIVIHGLWMTGIEASVLRGRLADYGFAVEQYHYRSVTADVESVVRELHARILAVPGPAHLVGHSLGGLVALRLAERLPDLELGNVVLLGSPVNGSQAARALASWPMGQWMLGSLPYQELLEGGRRWTRGTPLGVIAGTHSVGLGRFVGRLREPNDGTVAVAETRLDGATEHLELPVSHMGMLLSEDVASLVANFLRLGTFRKPPPL
jgi:pimeloyl-ACP methyl ester carboxylesterase